MTKRKTKETKPAKPAKPAKSKSGVVAKAAPKVLNAAPAPKREERNGVRRPAEGGRCAAVWSVLDMVLAKGTEPTTAQVKELAAKNGWNVNNATAELSAWRRFNGLSKAGVTKPKKAKRVAAEAAPPAAASDAAPAAQTL